VNDISIVGPDDLLTQDRHAEVVVVDAGLATAEEGALIPLGGPHLKGSRTGRVRARCPERGDEPGSKEAHQSKAGYVDYKLHNVVGNFKACTAIRGQLPCVATRPTLLVTALSFRLHSIAGFLPAGVTRCTVCCARPPSPPAYPR
jgi:hypothetical protein